MSNTVSISGDRAWSNRLKTIARVVSDLFSPAALAVPCLLLGVLGSDETDTYRFALLYFCVAIPAPIAYLVWLLKTGRVRDFHLPDRRDRTGTFVVAILSALAATVLLFNLDAPPDFLAPVVTALLQTLALFLVTLVWQISIHSATTAGLVTYAILRFGFAALPLAFLVPLVMWARVHLGRHTLAQTVAGVTLGGASFGALFALRGIVW